MGTCATALCVHAPHPTPSSGEGVQGRCQGGARGCVRRPRRHGALRGGVASAPEGVRVSPARAGHHGRGGGQAAGETVPQDPGAAAAPAAESGAEEEGRVPRGHDPKV